MLGFDCLPTSSSLFNNQVTYVVGDDRTGESLEQSFSLSCRQSRGRARFLFPAPRGRLHSRYTAGMAKIKKAFIGQQFQVGRSATSLNLSKGNGNRTYQRNEDMLVGIKRSCFSSNFYL